MKALADENFPRAAAEELRRRGWDFLCVQDATPAASDFDVAAMAVRYGRILLTFDKDFGEIWRRDPDGSPAIVLFRLPRLSAI
jgi:predicted nuclease of predicted toxin-antitoxin system